MNHRVIGCALTLYAVVALAACGAGTSEGQPPDRGSGGSAGAGSPAHPPGPASAPPSSAKCGDGAHITVDPAHQPTPVCLVVGQTVRLSTPASPLQPWEPVTSAAPDVVTCVSTHIEAGAVRAECVAREPGETVITTATMPFRGDPHGPVQQMWQLTIKVTS